MQREAKAVRILLADEQSLFREAMKVVLESQPDLRVVAEASSGCQAAMEAARTSPNVAVLSATLPHCDGIEATLRILDEADGCRVLVLSEQEDQQILLDALEAGACGYMTKESPLRELIEAVRAVHRGETLIPSWMLGSLLKVLIRRRREAARAMQLISSLTRREREVLALLTGGAGHDAIAERLVISPETARTHIQNVITKLGVHSRLEAAAYVRRNGIELAEARQ